MLNRTLQKAVEPEKINHSSQHFEMMVILRKRLFLRKGYFKKERQNPCQRNTARRL